MRTLVLFHSKTGHTRQVAEELAHQLDAQLGEIDCPAYSSWYGPAAMAIDIMTRHLPRVELTTEPSRAYDLVIIGGPVWAAQAAPPVLRLLRDRAADLPRIGLYVTCAGTSLQYPPERAVDEMKRAAPDRVIGTAIFREAARVSGAWRADARDFAAALKTSYREMLPMDGSRLEL